MNVDTAILITRDEDIDRASRSLKAMSHPLRLKILCTLGSQEISVQDIVESVGTSQSNISQHLAILRDKGILDSRKDANRVYYRVGDGVRFSVPRPANSAPIPLRNNPATQRIGAGRQTLFPAP